MRIRNKVALVDVDDTLLDFFLPFCDWMTREQKLPPITDSPDSYNLGAVFGLHERQIAPLVEQFFDTPHAAELPPWPNSVAGVMRLKELDYRIIAVSSCPRSVKAVKHRNRNIEKLFPGAFEAVHCLGLHATKKHIFNQYPRGIVIEDHLGHAITAAALGHESLLLMRPYNTSHRPLTRITRVMGWQDVISVINQEENYRV